MTGQSAQFPQHLKKFIRCGRRYRRALGEAQLRKPIRRDRSITRWLRDFSLRLRRHQGSTNGRRRMNRLPPLLYELLQIGGVSHGLCAHITILLAAPDPIAHSPQHRHVPLRRITLDAAC
ncbi:hypothetical protein NDU88_004205 [Pleurodeles waltl]|uniref:Uncharacterized protein n=1 Tax=Pleurodeles waltl TaxID=8319 RepID=A0AAV7MU77_PLEWA|nr:hypothetical protein NDU88_004205 [Pleurodeles waltl]